MVNSDVLLCVIERDLPLVRAAQCVDCGEIKLFSHFLVGRGRGECEAQSCKACRARRKPVKPRTSLTHKQLQSAVVDGLGRYRALPAVVVDALREKKRVMARAAQRQGVANRWERARLSKWGEALDGIRKELTATKHQKANMKKRLAGGGSDVDSVVRFCVLYTECLQTLRERIKELVRGDTKIERDAKNVGVVEWVSVFRSDEAALRRVADAWGAIRVEARLRMRVPSVLGGEEKFV